MRNSSMIKSIAVFDLDGTILAGDVSRFVIQTSPITQKCRFLFYRSAGGRDALRRQVTKYVEENDSTILISKINSYIKNRINSEVMEIANTLRKDHILVLNSGSPQLLVTEIANHLKFDYAFGSKSDHLNYGSSKYSYLLEHPSLNGKNRCFAISDNVEDILWMRNFQVWLQVKGHQIVYTDRNNYSHMC